MGVWVPVWPPGCGTRGQGRATDSVVRTDLFRGLIFLSCLLPTSGEAQGAGEGWGVSQHIVYRHSLNPTAVH